ncbi:hypothetical protein NYQ10_08930 [Flavobacterium johnsoniae]|uniref:hypothetical protein n=1 Tax=Flavobacterium johnsoniae TaxID=986 RepID=UPI0025AF3FFE|nr:hypothetical protein [Flavobacterium johnsoniae]WJS96570.1 hypothetical protein NYQ10_08930 [Flavobacterium johnsoniae]
MKKNYITIIFFFFLNCSLAQKATIEEKCPKIYENKFTEILNEKYVTVNGKDTTKINEIRYECVYSAFYTHKVMYDKYGKWDKEIFPSNRNHPILVWKNIDLFSNGKRYTILTNGLEEWGHIYASVMILDENERDILTEQTEEKIALTNFFGELLKKHNTRKKAFYEVYWKIVNPKTGEPMRDL